MKDKKVVLITGASSGIGAAAARLFAENGYHTVVADRAVKGMEALAVEITAQGGNAYAVNADVSDLASVQRMVQSALGEYGRIDVLVNNAGIGRLRWLEELDPVTEIAAQININLLGTIQTTRAVLSQMLERRSGHIINIASIAGFSAAPTYSIYAAGKFGVRGFSQALRREVGILGVKVSTIYPGGVDTDFARQTGMQRKTGRTTPKSLLLSAEDVAQVILKTASLNRSREVILPGIMRLPLWFNAHFPRLSDWLIERSFTRPERGM